MGGISFKNLEVLDWGLLECGEAFRRQEKLVEERIAGLSPDRLVFVEHPPVVTIGRSGSSADLCLSEEELRREGISLSIADRGGGAAFHGPGQMVVYPVVKLKDRDPHKYVRLVLETVADMLKSYGIRPEFKKGDPGIWVHSAKIASIGIAVRKSVTYHGIGLNVNNDLQAFNLFVPCVHPGERFTSIARELDAPLKMDEAKERFIESFVRIFGYSRSGLPPWLVHRSPCTAAVEQMEERLGELQLATVCQSAHCPNLGECFERGSATFMILGSLCTRECRFCAVDKGTPAEVDPGEPERVSRAVQMLGLKYSVITSVSRDDLPDGGAGQFVRTIEHIRKLCPDVRVEVLIPDFKHSQRALQQVLNAGPDMLNHNIETVLRLYPDIRPQAEYRRSLDILKIAAGQGLRVKSGIMLGLGETEDEVMETLADLKHAGCLFLTMGQYLAPSSKHTPVVRFLSPVEFERWGEIARSMGFKGVAAGPFVRSSYRSEEMFINGLC